MNFVDFQQNNVSVFANKIIIIKKKNAVKNINRQESSYFDGLQRILPVFGGIIAYLWNKIIIKTFIKY